MPRAWCFVLLIYTVAFSSTSTAQDYALKLSPGEQYVAGNNSNLPQGNLPRTLEAWVNSNSGSIQTIFNYGNVITSQRMGILLHSGRLYVVGQFNDIHGVINIPQNTWTHVAATYDGSTLKLYVNGVLDRSTPFPLGSHNATGTQWRIGMGNDTAPGNLFEPFTGFIDEVRVWNVARSQAQIANSMNECITGNEPTLVAHYRLDDGPNSNTASDHSASNATGALVNMDSSQSWVSPGAVPCDGLNLAGLEVVQVVQDWKNSARLAAGKFTAVRAHIANPAKLAQAGFTFRLKAFGGANLDQPLVPPFVNDVQGTGNQALSLPLSVDETTRANKRKSAHFWLPASWTTAGPKKFIVESDSAPVLHCLDQAKPTPNDCSVTVEFQTQKAIVVRMFMTEFHQIGGDTFITRVPDLQAACGQILKRFPTHQVQCTYDPNPIVFNSAATRPSSREILNATVARKLWTGKCSWNRCEDFYIAVTKFASGDGGDHGMAWPPYEGYPWSRSAWAVGVSVDPSAAPHELAHNLDLQHPTTKDLDTTDDVKNGTCGEDADISTAYPPSNSFYFPYYDGNDPLLGPLGDDQLLVFGYDAATDSIIKHTEKSLMSYCSKTLWPDIGSYNKLAEDLASTEAPAGAPPVPNPDPYFFVTGTVNVLTELAEFDPVEIHVPPFVPDPIPVTDWALLAHFASGPDAAHPLALSYSPNEPNLAGFFALVPYDAEITGFTVQRSGAPLAEVTASNNEPEISITAPAPGTQFSAEDLMLEWDASDADNDELTFIVEYSADGGSSWASLSVNWPGSPFTVFSDRIEPSQNALFRVTALDGFHSTSATLQGTVVVKPAELVLDDGFE